MRWYKFKKKNVSLWWFTKLWRLFTFSRRHYIFVTILFSTFVRQVTNNATCRKKTIQPAKKPTHSTSLSSSMPNLFTSDGTLKRFPYNPDETSAQSELIHIMGQSVIDKDNKTTLPIFPGGVKKFAQFSERPRFYSGNINFFNIKRNWRNVYCFYHIPYVLIIVNRSITT